MTRKLNIRISDEISESVEKIAREVNKAGGNGTISQVARRLIEEGLLAMSREDATPNERGAEFETTIYRQIKAALWDGEVEHLHPRSGESRPDIRAPFFDVECKTGRRPSTRKALKQARESCAENQVPVAVIKDDEGEPFVVVDWYTFLALWRSVYEISVFAEDMPRRLASVEGER